MSTRIYYQPKIETLGNFVTLSKDRVSFKRILQNIHIDHSIPNYSYLSTKKLLELLRILSGQVVDRLQEEINVVNFKKSSIQIIEHLQGTLKFLKDVVAKIHVALKSPPVPESEPSLFEQHKVFRSYYHLIAAILNYLSEQGREYSEIKNMLRSIFEEAAPKLTKQEREELNWVMARIRKLWQKKPDENLFKREISGSRKLFQILLEPLYKDLLSNGQTELNRKLFEQYIKPELDGFQYVNNVNKLSKQSTSTGTTATKVNMFSMGSKGQDQYINRAVEIARSNEKKRLIDDRDEKIVNVVEKIKGQVAKKSRSRSAIRPSRPSRKHVVATVEKVKTQARDAMNASSAKEEDARIVNVVNRIKQQAAKKTRSRKEYVSRETRNLIHSIKTKVQQDAMR